jgi:hypothetical protein
MIANDNSRLFKRFLPSIVVTELYPRHMTNNKLRGTIHETMKLKTSLFGDTTNMEVDKGVGEPYQIDTKQKEK